MKKQNLQGSLTIDHNFPGKASHCCTFFFFFYLAPLRPGNNGQNAKRKGKASPTLKVLKAENVPLKNNTLRNRRTAKKYTHC